MTQPPYGQGADPYQQSPDQGGYGSPGQGGYGTTPQAGYGTPADIGYGTPAQGGPGAAPHQQPYHQPYQQPYQQGGSPGGPPMYGVPQAGKSKTGLIIATVVGVLAIAGVILAVVLINNTPGPSAVVQGDDAALNALAQSCFDGEMPACDDLFLQSPVDSDYEAYGNTCGGRIEEADVDQRYCVDIF